MEISCRVYKPRRPRESPLYRLVEQHLEELLRVWPARFVRQHGALRPVVERVLREFLKCGLLEHGFARLWCGECHRSILVALSCRGRGFCPSCEKKKQLLWAEWLREAVLLGVAHRHVVLTIPRLLRPLFRRRRELLGELARAGAEAVKELVRHASDEGDARPGIVVSVASAGDLLQWHPHLHLITTDGQPDPQSILARAASRASLEPSMACSLPLALRRRLLPGIAGLLTTSACGRLESIPCRPPQTPESWLASQPFAELTIASRRVIVVQPSTTAIVYLLGILSIGVGVRCLRTHNHQRSRLWWGFALVLWGVGALLAGTSYEGFSYAIKCAGRTTCAWTSWWEVVYLILTVWSIDAMVMAAAHACAVGRWRRGLSFYATANAVLYLILVLTGAFLPIRFLVSFELLVLVAAPSILALFGLNVWRYRRVASRLDLALVGTWLWLGLTVGAYYLYLVLGVTQVLWARGLWFSENDVLHVGLIIWMLFIAIVVAPELSDRPEAETPSGR